jgi:hypothetical protein
MKNSFRLINFKIINTKSVKLMFEVIDYITPKHRNWTCITLFLNSFLFQNFLRIQTTTTKHFKMRTFLILALALTALVVMATANEYRQDEEGSGDEGSGLTGSGDDSSQDNDYFPTGEEENRELLFNTSSDPK